MSNISFRLNKAKNTISLKLNLARSLRLWYKQVQISVLGGNTLLYVTDAQQLK